MAFGSSYSAVKAALVTLLTARAGLSGVAINYETPIRRADLVSTTGAYESISMGEAEGNFEDRLNCGVGEIFDESYTLFIYIQVLTEETSTTNPQQVIDERAETLLYEVLAELSNQSNWNLTALNLSQFSYITVLPVSQEWSPGFLEGTTDGRGITCRLGVSVNSRRTF